jgi:hypothetical protein
VTRRAWLGLLGALLFGCSGSDLPAGEIQGTPRPIVEDAAAAVGGDRILFGDLHVHTTYSIDAFIYSLPLFGGGGSHPPADACDFARHCSQLDFFSITDHAEGLTPDHWRRIKESARECNARAGDPTNPDVVSYIGWEWTQAGFTPDDHFGHKNVIFPELDEDHVPVRPINSLPDGTMDRSPPVLALRAAQAVLAPFSGGAYADFLWMIQHLAETPACALGVDVHELPANCMENAARPADLFRKLRQWGFETLVIPHGLAWGIHAPPASNLDVQLNPEDHDPGMQRLLEIYSGHGSSEGYRDWPDEWPNASFDDRACPAPTGDRMACCWRAGEIARERCGDLPEAECSERVETARRLALAAGRNVAQVFPDAPAEAWLDCDQCRDCFKPVYNPRPGMSAQYAAAITGDDGLRYRFGFIASSDDHKAQPGTGYKQMLRRKFTDGRGIASASVDRWLRPMLWGDPDDPSIPQPVPVQTERGFRDLMDVERVASFLYPGGLVAVHAAGRDRRSIWDALVRREVYGTSGPRILLWFDLVNGPDGRLPMGSEVALASVPRFEVRALGSLVQKPGCPASSVDGLSPERLERLCAGECYNPSDERVAIEAIEVVRIRVQRQPGESVAPLIEDPWLRLECAPDPTGCRVAFEDPEFPSADRDTVYYVRALQTPTPAINGRNLRTTFDAAGNPVSVDPCFANHRSDDTDDCLAPVQERAWSSPIYVDRS